MSFILAYIEYMLQVRPLLKALHDHWSFVDALVQKSKESPYWDGESLFRLALGFSEQNASQAEENVRQLILRGILVDFTGRNEYQIHGPTREYVLSLTQEHDLGLSEMIRVQVDEMSRLGQDFLAFLDKEDLAALQLPLNRLGSLAQAISIQLEHDMQAILNIADRAKTKPSDTPLEDRYREVIESYDRYVEPMNQLLQRNQSGFTDLTVRIEDFIARALDLCDRRGALVSQRRRLKGTAYALRALRQSAREKLARCTETLLPLREEYQRCNKLSISIASLLGIVRKRGLSAAIPSKVMPLGGGSRRALVVPGRFAKGYMADILQFRPSPVTFPDSPVGPSQTQIRLHWDAVVNRLRADLPITDLLSWLLLHYPDQDEKEILRLYHLVVRSFPEQSRLSDEQAVRRMHCHALRLYPHYIEAAP